MKIHLKKAVSAVSLLAAGSVILTSCSRNDLHNVYETVSATVADTVSEIEVKGSQLLDAVSFAAGLESLSFDELICRYYSMLSPNLQTVYQQLYQAVTRYQTEITPGASLSVSEAEAVVLALVNDHPELFWLGSKYSVSYLKNGKALSIQVSFCLPVEEIDAAKIRFDTVAEEILGIAGQLPTFYEREKYVHDYILNHAEYDASDVEAAQSAYSALVMQRTVCAGYSRAFQYLMNRLNVPTYYCTGYSSGDHAWNIVRLDDGFYNVDLTWDARKPVSYAYFNRSDAEFSSTHSRTGYSVYLPACASIGYRGPTEYSNELPAFAQVIVPESNSGSDISDYGTEPPSLYLP